MTGHSSVEATLDEFHRAAAAADEDRYFATMSDDVVFLGTAPGERWAGEEWRVFVHSFFVRGVGWSYTPSDRSVILSPDGDVAWFDETVENETYGSCRGTGVLRRDGTAWRITQYNLTLPVPDELVAELVPRIREMRPA